MNIAVNAAPRTLISDITTNESDKCSATSNNDSLKSNDNLKKENDSLKRELDDAKSGQVTIDETELNEIPLTTGYLQGNSPVEVAITIAKKINSKLDVDLMLSELKYYLPNYEIDIIDSEVFI